MRIPTLLIGLLLAAPAAAGCGAAASGEVSAAKPPKQKPAGNQPAWKLPPDKPQGPRPGLESGTARSFSLLQVADGLQQPNQVIARAGDAGLYVVEQHGTIRRLVSGGAPALFLDLRGRTRAAGERGLLSAAFSPRGDSIVALYTNRRGDTRVTEFPIRNGSPDAGAGSVLLAVEQPYENHKGGTVLFDERGRLLVSLGDGGSAFDPGNRGQSSDGRLAGILRLENDRWEKIAFGLRNPWRMSFDDVTGLLWIGDVGQDRFEEIDAIYPPETGQPRVNLGWAAYEGHLPLGRKRVARGRLIWPVAGYAHRDGHCSVTGGAVYRGSRVPALDGRYVYGDFCRGTLWSLDAAGAEGRTSLDVRREEARVPGLSSFGKGGDGELYAVSIQGIVFKIVPYS